MSSSLALFILIMLLIVALFTSYMLQQKKIQAVHETVLSIFGGGCCHSTRPSCLAANLGVAGMVVGLIIRLTSNNFIQSVVTFNYQFFFNLLLPPIILASGYELHQANFFRNIGSILTFAFAGTFISAIVLAVILYLWTLMRVDGFTISFVEAFSVGATLSATDPVTILAIFNAYKVDPKLYTVIFGESILNDAIAIVLFETAQKYVPSKTGQAQSHLSVLTFFEAIGVFLLVFFGSLVIGVGVGVLATLLLKFTHVRKFPKIESCLVILIAYASYFFANGIGMSGKHSCDVNMSVRLTHIGIVALLFCGITLKHYAYYNMSRRSQLTTKYIFQVLAQLSENFIFIYLGITLFTGKGLYFNPLFILIATIGICVARYAAVFPLSKVINWTIRFRARRRGESAIAEELPHSYQVMLFWAGLRGAVGVALAEGIDGNDENVSTLRATVLVVVVLTVIIFGGTTARMLEIMGIRTGVVDEVDSDDEFDIETTTNGTYYKRSGNAFGHTPSRNDFTMRLGKVDPRANGNGHGGTWESSYSSGSNNPSPPARPTSTNSGRHNSIHNPRGPPDQTLLGRGTTSPSEEELYSDSDLPPAAPRRSPKRRPSPPPGDANPYPTSGSAQPTQAGDHHMTATGALREFFTGTDDSAAWFQRLDEGIIKPTLLLDQSSKGGGGGGGPGGAV